MKALTTITIISFVLLLGSCEKPSETIAGTYTGSMSASYNGSDTLNDATYVINVVEVDKNNITVKGDHIPNLELLVTDNGLNVELVDPDHPQLQDFVYIGDEKKLKMNYVDGDNYASFLGWK